MEKDSQEQKVVATPADLTSGSQAVAPVQTWPFPPPPGLPPVERMRMGFDQFKRGMFDMYPDLFRMLANGQAPEFMVFSCSDSRVCPSHVLNFWPGEAFMFRNIANLVPAYEARDSGVGAAIEYAVLHLKVKNIVVIGHSRCGGIQALMDLPDDGSTSSDFIEEWVKIGLPARAIVKAEYPNLTPEQQLPILEREAVKLSVSNLQTYPFVAQAVMTRRLILHSAYYDFVDGHFEIL